MTRQKPRRKPPCRCGGTGWDDTDPLDPKACPDPRHELERQARLEAAAEDWSPEWTI